VLIGVIGDATLDVSVEVSVGPAGAMSAGDARAPITVGPGGQGANVAVRLARTGIPVRLIAPLADDPAGRVVRGHLEDESVEVAPLPASRTSMVVVMVAPGGERMMLSDRVRAEGDLASTLDGCGWVHVSGYLLRESSEAERVVDAIGSAGIARISVAGGSFEGWADARVARDAINAISASLLVFNRDEAGLMAGAPMRSAEEAAAALGTGQRLAFVTDGERGAAVAGGPVKRTLGYGHAQESQPAIDSTGAGDAFTASLIGSLASAWPPSAELVAAALERASQEGAAATSAIGAQSVAPARPSGFDR
jgi:ribokinase